jgi:hypothetical protein
VIIALQILLPSDFISPGLRPAVYDASTGFLSNFSTIRTEENGSPHIRHAEKSNEFVKSLAPDNHLF